MQSCFKISSIDKHLQLVGVCDSYAIDANAVRIFFLWTSSSKENVCQFKESYIVFFSICYVRMCCSVTSAVRDFPEVGETVVRMYAGDCDVTDANRRHTYTIGNITFQYLPLDPNSPDQLPDYTLSSSDSGNVQNAFTVDPATGDVNVGLPNYRPYSFGKFKATVTATDSQGRQDTSTIYVSSF